MLTIDTQKLIESLLARGMRQAHLGYDFTICKGSEIPSKLKSSIKENSSNFFDGGADMQYVVLKVPESKMEPPDATSKIAQLIKTNFLDGDPNNAFTTSEVQVGYLDKKPTQVEKEQSEEESEEANDPGKEKKEPARKMFYVLKFKIVK